MKKRLLTLTTAAYATLLCSATTGIPMPQMPASHLEQQSADGKLVECRELRSNYALELRELPNGMLYKTLRRTVPPCTSPTQTLQPNADTQTAPSFYENFSGWDGTTPNWLPDGWSQQNSSDEIKTLKDGAFIWHTIAPASTTLPKAIDGDYYAMIYAASYKDDTGTRIELPQDEWLITPTFTPKSDEYFSFYLAYNPLYLFNCTNQYLDFSDPNEIKFKEKVPATTMKIKIRESGGEWIQLHDVYDEWKDDYDFQDLYDNFGQAFYFYQFNLADYVGKDVQIAFQFVGIYGNAMEIDAVKVGIPSAEAYYHRPTGAFYWGFSSTFDVYGSLGDMSMLVPAYTDLQWTNMSPDGAIAFQWEYPNPQNSDVNLKTNDYNLTTKYPAQYNSDEGNWYIAPTLTAYATPEIYDKYQTPYPWIQAGGKAIVADYNGKEQEFGVGNYNFADGYNVAANTDGAIPFGYSDQTDAFWTNLFGGVYDIHVTALGNSFEKPIHPYVLSKVSILGIGEMADDAVLTLTLKAMSAQGIPSSKVIATGTCKGSEIIKTTVNGNEYICAPFRLTDENGIAREFIIDEAIIAVVTGFDVNVTTFAPFQTAESNKSAENNAWIFFDFNKEGNSILSNRPYRLSDFYSGGYYGSFLFNLDATYPWIECRDNTFEASVAGGSKSFAVNSFYSADKWTVTVSDDASEWLTCTANGRRLTLTAATNDTGSDRSCSVIVSAPACSMTFAVTQKGNAAIDTIGSDSDDIDISTEGTAITIQNNSSATEGRLFNITGRIIKEFHLNTGANTIDAAGMAPGVYIISLNNGFTAKIIR